MSKKHFAKFLFFAVFLSSLILDNNLISQQGWFQVSSVSSGFLRGIYFIDNNNGIIDGYKTTNGGLTWNYRGVNGLSTMFINQYVGFIVGDYIYKTTNFGGNWSSQSSPVQMLKSVYFPSLSTGYTCGIGAQLLKTTNNGNTWFLQNIPALNNIYSNNIFFTNNSTGFISGNVGFFHDSCVILKTTSGGLNWTVNLIFMNDFTLSLPIFFINSNIGFIGGDSIIYKTTNAGVSWIPKSSPTHYIINSIFFPSTSTGYAACYSGEIIKTTNTGENWFRQYPATFYDLRSVYFINDFNGFISCDAGVILKTTNGGGPPIGIKSNNEEVPKLFYLFQNYPNPFNPVTKIKFDIPSNVKRKTANAPLSSIGEGLGVRLAIYDVLGRVIAVLVNSELIPGSYEIDFDGSNYPSGVYFYRLVAGVYSETRKMVLLR